MKQENLIVLGLAGVAVYLIAKSKGVKLAMPTLKTKAATTYDKVSEILNTDGSAYDNGWRYFSDGTAIDPLGNYFKDNKMIWENPTPTNSLVIPNIQQAGYTVY